MRADLHIHTVLSPCGDIEMSPINIIERAKANSIELIGVTDHNSTLMGPIIKEIGEREGVKVLCGAEITTIEELHIVVFVEGRERLATLQEYLSKELIKVPNNPDIFGYQLVVNEQEEVLYQEENLLIGAIEQSVDQLEQFIHSLGGIFIPAHIDKKRDSILSQLGFIDPLLRVEALELSPHCNVENFFKNNSYLSKYGIISSSDAHYPQEIGRCYTNLEIEEYSFEAVKEAIKRSTRNNISL